MRISLQSVNNRENHSFSVGQTLIMDNQSPEISHLLALDPIQVKARVTRPKDSLYRVDVKQVTEAKLVCSRCLQSFSMPLEGEWEAQFSQVSDMSQEAAEEETQLLKSDFIDLAPLVREALLLQIPYAPICQRDCKGLCPVCGADRNQVVCHCETKVIDPRLAKLQDFSEEG